jgi:hypothetical protein
MSWSYHILRFFGALVTENVKFKRIRQWWSVVHPISVRPGQNVTDYFQFIDPVSFKKPAAEDCHPARTHDVHPKARRGTKFVQV